MFKKKPVLLISEQDKKLVAIIKMKIPAQNASSKEPVGPALGQYGIPITEFCKNFNESSTEFFNNIILFAELYYYNNKTNKLVVKTPHLSYYLLKAISFIRGSRKTKKLVRTRNDFLPVITSEMLFEIITYNNQYKNKNMAICLFKNVVHQLKSIGIIYQFLI